MPVIGKYKGREITGGSQDVVNAQVRAIEALGNSNSASQTTPQSTGGGQLTPTFTAGNTRGGQAMPDRINIGGKSYSFDKVQGSPDLREQYLAQQNQQQEQAPEIAPQEVEEQAEVTPFEPQVTTQPEDIRSQALEFLRERGFDSPDDETIQGVAEQLSGGVQGTGATGSESPFVQGFIGATQRGVEAPTGPAQGHSLVQSYLPEQPETQIANDLFATDPFFSQLQQSLQDYFNPKSQRESLTSLYQDMLEDSGVEAIDMELIDMKNVIEGTEDDIRTEVTKAGGFATDSQVLALANARNKQLIKNYNTLLETRNAKQQYLDKMMDLSSKDREIADRQFNTMMNFGFQVANFKQQAKQNAISNYTNMMNTLGADVFYDQIGGDPNSISLAERTLGLSPGGLRVVANNARLERTREAEMYEINKALKLKELYGTDEGMDLTEISNALNQNPSSGNIRDVLATIFQSDDISAGTRTQISDVLNVASALEDFSTANLEGDFKGVGPTESGLFRWGVGVPSFGVSEIIRGGIKLFSGEETKEERAENIQQIEAINLKVQQWASGAALTDKQTKQVERLTPDRNDTDKQMMRKISGLYNFMVGQTESQLITEGINIKFPEIDLFEIYKLRNQASPEQREEIDALIAELQKQ